jgi:hypothetical protein
MNKKVPHRLQRQNVEDHMYTILIGVVECFMQNLIVEPPNFSFLHSDFLVPGTNETTSGALDNEVVSVSQIVVKPSVNMPVDLTVRLEPHNRYPPGAPIHPFNEFFDPC